MGLTKVISLLVFINVVQSIQEQRLLDDTNLVLQPGYPGYKQPKFSFAPRQPEGRSLFYRKTPRVEKYQSAVHELYMRPYNYANLEHHAVAVINLDNISGAVHFHQTGGPTSPVRLLGNITGLTPGHHGFHIHQLGDTSQGCKSMKGHFNPFQIRHGAPEDNYRHVGDLGNILAGEDGVAIIDVEDSQISLNGLNSVIGRGVVIHAGKDDLGKGGDEGSLKTGNAGGRVACAVIGRADMTV
eukprot:GFUD01000628.1.p1 GENE.GFUD01000628.1~~GFUD01000628.1.p1  ORF type:complete len:241 (-),score=63.39 GFUD01000628.1:249-971(-)